MDEKFNFSGMMGSLGGLKELEKGMKNEEFKMIEGD